MFIARFAHRRLSTIFAAPATAPARAPSALRRPGSTPSTRTCNRVRWTNNVEVKEIDIVQCQHCNKGHYQCKCLRRKYRYNGRMSVTFVTFKSQIASDSTPPSVLNRVVEYFTAVDAPLTTNAAGVPSDTSTNIPSSTNGSVRRSKRTRYSRSANTVEQTGNDAEDEEPVFDHNEDLDLDDAVVAPIGVSKPMVLKQIESSLDGAYWAPVSGGKRTRRAPVRL